MAATTAAPARELPGPGPGELPRRIGLIFAGLMSAMLLASLDQTIVSSIALVPVVGELHGVNHMGWVTTAYIVAAAAASTRCADRRSTGTCADVPAGRVLGGLLAASYRPLTQVAHHPVTQPSLGGEQR